MITLVKIKKYLELFAITSGIVFTFWKFVLEDYIIPRSYPPFLIVKCIMEKLETNESFNDSLVFIRLTCKVKNASKNKINLVFSKYEINGIKFTNGSDFDSSYHFKLKYHDKSFNNNEWEALDNGDGSYNLEYTDEYSNGVISGTIFDNHEWLQDNDEAERSYVFPISKKYTTAYVEVTVYYTKDDIPGNFYKNQFINKEGELLNLISPMEYNDSNDLDRIIKDNNLIIEKYHLIETKSQYEILINK